MWLHIVLRMNFLNKESNTNNNRFTTVKINFVGPTSFLQSLFLIAWKKSWYDTHTPKGVGTRILRTNAYDYYAWHSSLSVFVNSCNNQNVLLSVRFTAD